MVRPKTFPHRLPDSPSRQLIRELTRDLEQVRLHNEELKLLKAYERRSFYENLDRLDQEREDEHIVALNAAAAKRDQKRLTAEETLKQHFIALEEERKRKEEQERHRREKIERERAEKERQVREEVARLEAERRAKDEEVKRHQAAAAERARKEAEEKARQEQNRLEEEKKKAQKVEEARLKKQTDEAGRKAAQKEQAESTISVISHRTPQEIASQQRYTELHRHLKSFRRYMLDQAKSNPIIKQNMGDMRRTIRKCVGQLLPEDKVANRKPTAEIVNTLKKSLAISEPTVDVRQFIASPPSQIANSQDSKVPALFVYLLNIVAKAIIAQLMAEAGVSTKYAEPLGVLAAQIFSMDSFLFQGHTMIDILIAKYRVLCPALWGFYGDEASDAGKTALGWWREEAGGPFVNRQAHEERMTGLGAGFAAIALRNFSKSPRQNPYPNSHFWTSLSYIVNVPPAEVQDTHLIILEAMLRHSAPRIIGFWGAMGILALRQAIVEFPARIPKKSTPKSMVQDLRDIYAREKRVII
ncbi:hypothetical protein FQN57_006901 [Myotisia sp. PD_48]|nr:hypothetical protein FQN57_006901 [Myotisia sp. PD_48]